MIRRFMACALALGCLSAPALLTPSSAHAAEYTDLLDAADDFDDLDEETWDPFDFALEPSFRFFVSNAKIAREAPCVPQEPYADVPDDELTEGQRRIQNNPRLVVDEGRCGEAKTIYNKEMDFTGTRAQLDLKLRAGIYKDLELRINVPYVFSNTRQLGYDDDDPNAARNVGPQNSSVDPNVTCPNGEEGRCVQREAESTFDPNASNSQQVDSLDNFNGYRFFNLRDENSYQRSGFAEPSIGLHWAMFNDERDPTKATLTLGADYTMPIVPIATANDFAGDAESGAVGHGMHILDFQIASSKSFGWIEPYFGLLYSLRLASARSPIREIDRNNEGQVFTNPPMSGEITLGTEFVPFEDKTKGQRYGVDLRFTFGYVSEGRNYTPMFDHFANSQCNGKTIQEVLPQYDTNGNLQNPGDVACSWIVQEPSNADTSPVYDLGQAAEDGNDDTFTTDGIMTVEGHGIFRGLLGVYLQPNPNFQFKLLATLEHRQEHFITNARTGSDVEDSREQTPDDTVDLEGPDASLERNPVYNPVYDSAGERFRIQRYNIWMFMATTAIQF